MHLRPATTSDLPKLVELTITSISEEPYFNYLYPYRHEYPSDALSFWQLNLQKLLYDPKTSFLVMVLDAGDRRPDEATDAILDTIIAYVVWLREGYDRAALKRRWKKDTWINVLGNITTRLSTLLPSYAHPRRDISFPRLTALHKATNTHNKTYFPKHPNKWTLEKLVTSKSFRRRGAATALIKWGTDIADQEVVVCKVEASEMGKVVYEAAGFRVLDDWTVQVVGQEKKLTSWVMMRDNLTTRCGAGKS